MISVDVNIRRVKKKKPPRGVYDVLTKDKKLSSVLRWLKFWLKGTWNLKFEKLKENKLSSSYNTLRYFYWLERKYWLMFCYRIAKEQKKSTKTAKKPPPPPPQKTKVWYIHCFLSFFVYCSVLIVIFFIFVAAKTK